MIDDSLIGRMAQDILEEIDPGFQWLIETSTEDERKTYQHVFAAYVAQRSGEPYGHLYRAFGRVMAEIVERTGQTIH